MARRRRSVEERAELRERAHRGEPLTAEEMASVKAGIRLRVHAEKRKALRHVSPTARPKELLTGDDDGSDG